MLKDVTERLNLNSIHESTIPHFHQMSYPTIYRVAKSALGDANFDFRKWIANNFKFSKQVTSRNNNDFELAQLNDYCMFLCLQWQLSLDKIVFKMLPLYELVDLLKPAERNKFKTTDIFQDQ